MREIISPISMLIGTLIGIIIEIIFRDFNPQRLSVVSFSLYLLFIALLNSPFSKFKIPLKKSWRKVRCRITFRLAISSFLAAFSLLACPEIVTEVIFSSFFLFEFARSITLLKN